MVSSLFWTCLRIVSRFLSFLAKFFIFRLVNELSVRIVYQVECDSSCQLSNCVVLACCFLITVWEKQCFILREGVVVKRDQILKGYLSVSPLGDQVEERFQPQNNAAGVGLGKLVVYHRLFHLDVFSRW